MEPVPSEQLHNRMAGLTFGALQVSFGILVVLIDIAAILFDRNSLVGTIFGSGIWAGIVFILAGAFGIVAAQQIPPHQTPRSRRCYLITTLVFTVFGLIFTGALTPLASVIVPVMYSYYTGLLVFGFATIHAVLFGVMFIVNLGQLISASVNIHKLQPSVSLATIIMTTTTTAFDPRAVAAAVETHPATMTHPYSYNGLPPPYNGQQQAYVLQAAETHPK